jgi:hypothetical protein
MPILRIQHAVPNFEGWKRAFESDPMDRKAAVTEVETLLEKLRRLWAGPGGSVMRNPEAWIVETVESKSL